MRLALAALALASASALAGCGGGDGPADALRDAGLVHLYAPTPQGAEPMGWILHDGTLQLVWDSRSNFRGTLAVNQAPRGDLCAVRGSRWDRCDHIDKDAIVLGFEEQNAIVVRRGTTQLSWDVSLELPDEDYESAAALRAAQREIVDGLVDAARTAPELTPAEFVKAVPGTTG